MKLLYFLSISILISSSTVIKAQNKKVGIGTQYPTEILDVNGTMRVRDIPAIGSSHTDANGNTTAFSGTSPVVSSNNYNIVGKTTKAEFVPNNINTNFNTTNNSSAMFVIKRYAIGDWPSKSGDVGMPTGMDGGKWEAIMSNVSFSFTLIQQLSNVFNENHLHSWSMFVNAPTGPFPGGEWRIVGDINGVQEKSDYVDILFIKKTVVGVLPNARNERYTF